MEFSVPSPGSWVVSGRFVHDRLCKHEQSAIAGSTSSSSDTFHGTHSECNPYDYSRIGPRVNACGNDRSHAEERGSKNTGWPALL